MLDCRLVFTEEYERIAITFKMYDKILTHYDLNLSDTELRFLLLVCTSSHSHNIYNKS